jgi:RNA polymerase sigma-54 factor
MNWLQPKLHLKVAQKQILTPGLVQMVTVLALNRLELREMINQEMVENPVLEDVEEIVADEIEDLENPEKAAAEDAEGEPGADRESEEGVEDDGTREMQEVIREELMKEGADFDGPSPFDEFDINAFFQQYLDTGGENHREHEDYERPSFEQFLSSPQSLADHLNWQLAATICSEPVRKIAEIIIGNLDDNGYLTVTLEEIAQQGNFTMDDVEEALAVVQEFDPLGVSARNLRECLLIQLRTLDPQNTLAHQIVSDFLPRRPTAEEEDGQNPETSISRMLQNNQLKEIARTLNRPIELVKRAVDVIKKLDPRPGLRYNKSDARLVEPDVYFRKVDNEWKVFFNEDDLPQLRLSPVYRRLLARDAADKDVRNYVKERFTAAIQLLKNIEQRKHTIVRVCESILRRQRDFLEYGIDQLKPMMIKEVAEEVGVHPSTVSRAVANKYAHTPQGVHELRYFFSESVNGPQGSTVSLLTLKRRVKKMIEEEDTAHPLTDEQIAKRLEEEGIHVTRRTVAKYREDLRIPSTHQRRVKT